MSALSEEDALIAIQEILQHLEAVSFVAHRDATQAMPAVEPYGAQATLGWLEAGRELFFHDRDAGKAFLRQTPATVEKAGCVTEWVEQARALAVGPGAWKALEGFMEQAGDVYAAWGAGAAAEWHALGRKWLERHVDSGVAYFRTPFRELAGDEGVAGLERIMAPAERLFQERRLALGSYLEGALKVRKLIGVDGVAEWASRGADILQAGRRRGEAYFRLDTEESMAMLLEAMPGLRMRDRARVFQLLAMVWFGELLPIEDSRWSPDQGRAFVETDGIRLFLPVVMPDREEAFLAVLHTAGHLRFGSYEQTDINALFAEAGMTHPPVDADQRITWRPLFAPFAEDMFRIQALFDACEDLRVDACIHRILPGHLDRLVARAERGPVPAGAPGEYYLWALENVRAVARGEAPEPALQPLLEPDADLLTAWRIARALYAADRFPPLDMAGRDAAYLPGRSPNAARPVYPRQDNEARLSDDKHGVHTEGKDEQSPEELKQEIPKDAAGDDPDFDIPPEDTAGSGGRVGVGIPQPTAVVGRGLGHRAGTDGVAYREWDYRAESYKMDWARVREQQLEENEPERAVAIMTEHANALKRLRRALQMQRPQRPAPERRQLDGDDLDLEATMEYVAEKRAGRSPQARVFKRRNVLERDTAVLLLADLSTSIMAEVSEGEGRVVDRLRAGLMLFAEALETVGDPYAIAGFASKYRDNISYYPLKDFGDTLTPSVRGAIAGVSGRLATRMGAAMRHALTRFDNAPSERRLLLLLSDGRPADYDDGGDERYLHEDTRMAVKEAKDRGVHPFCVTLDPAGSEYLPNIFGPGHYLILDHVDDLPRRLPEIYLRLRKA